MRYNRGNINETLAAAVKTSKNETKFVFATGFGYKIDNKKPFFNNQDYYIVEKGKIKLVEVKFK